MKFESDYLVEQKKKQPFPIKTSANGVQFKEIDTTGRVIKAVVNTLNYFDYDFDVLLKGCANRSISQRGAKTDSIDKIAHLLHHDMRRPVGKSQLEAEQVIDGKSVLYCESFLPDTVDGDDTLTKYEVGMYNQHSIGFRYVDLEFVEKGAANWDKILAKLINPEDADKVGYLWAVKEIKWWEYSTVTFGANKLTPYLGTKSENKLEMADAISKKIAILATQAMRREIKNEEAFKFELSQLQQMVYELSSVNSLKQIPPPESPESESTEQKKVSLTGFSKSLNFKIN